ncbi:MAG TPA: aspartyl/asparaginyl beta-hydroxylase domain-containing protein [Casimicrobiaceae bacterium]|nr:aspartyl/asparaginyl beta-hydroxylase domain-containing protein [Casimicrobiaceae bacterium]
MQDVQNRLREINALEGQAMQAAQTGRNAEAQRLWARILELDPNHVRTLSTLGQRAFRGGDMPTARIAFQRIVDVDGSDPQQWIQLAVTCRNLQDEAAEESAIQQALTRDPGELVALILRASLLERQGRTHEAVVAYSAVAAVAPPLDRLRPELRPAVVEANERVERYNRDRGAFLDRYLDAHCRDFAGEDLGRFRDSVDIMVGRKRRYDSRSTIFHYPGLAPVEFFDRALFPWLDRFEAATDDIRAEFLNVLATEEGFTPYISYPDDVPKHQFAELNNSPRWSAFHLFKMGQRVAENAARCPLTMQLLESAPQPDQPGRTPSAMFSLLKPQTRIPPHTGVSNVRLVTHVPLIIPEQCGFRVGNTTRDWIPGQAFVFDDTIEHEAWNMSDKLRVVLLFDVWHPDLTPPERALITALAAGLNEFTAGAPAPGESA